MPFLARIIVFIEHKLVLHEDLLLQVQPFSTLTAKAGFKIIEMRDESQDSHETSEDPHKSTAENHEAKP